MAVKHYYFAPKSTVMQYRLLFTEWVCFAPHNNTPGEGDDEVFLMAQFGDEGAIDHWEGIPGVTALPHGLDLNETWADEHMEKLSTQINMDVATVTVDDPADSSLPPGQRKKINKKQFTCKETGKVLDRNHNTREAMNRLAQYHCKAFKFRVF